MGRVVITSAAYLGDVAPEIPASVRDHTHVDRPIRSERVTARELPSGMDQPEKHAYILDLSAPTFAAAQRTTNIDPNNVIRSVVPNDAEALAQLMLEAYRGTIDYEGEEIQEARDAIDEFFSGAPLVSASMIAAVDGAAVSAVLVISLDAGPFISYVVTHPAHKRSGLAAQVVTTACRRLAESGENKVSFAITDGNVASEALFNRLGAVRLPS